MAEFFEYLPLALTLKNLLTLILGVIGGLILGATPGLSPTMAVALLVPFTFHMDPTTGLILLGAVYTATVAGGAISAILINIPGAPANIATLLGLTGTIFGLMVTFDAVANVPVAQRAAAMANGIAFAMSTTLFGLIVAVPSIFFSGILAAKSDKIIEEMDEKTAKLINLVEE